MKYAFGIFSSKWKIFQRKFNVTPYFAVDIVKAGVVLHSFVREREREREREKYGCKLDTMTVTGLDDVPDGQSVRGGLAANNVRNKVAEYFLQMLERFPGKCKKNEQ